MSRLRERPSEVATLLGLVRFSLPFIYGGVLLTLVFGLWLVHAAGQGYSYGDAWAIAALVLWVLANALGGAGGAREAKQQEVAAGLARERDAPPQELGRELRDPGS